MKMFIFWLILVKSYTIVAAGSPGYYPFFDLDKIASVEKKETKACIRYTVWHQDGTSLDILKVTRPLKMSRHRPFYFQVSYSMSNGCNKIIMLGSPNSKGLEYFAWAQQLWQSSRVKDKSEIV